MNRDEAFEVIRRILALIQEMSGEEVLGITPKTVPIRDLPGFDSYRGLEFSVMVPPELKWCEQNLCISEDGTRALCIGEIIDRVLDPSS